MQNFKMWVAQSDIDYTTAFIKAWIPFNAWYNTKYAGEGKANDGRKIDRIINDTANNPVRAHIDWLMKSDSGESTELKSYLAGLHRALNTAALEFDGYSISFENITGKNICKEEKFEFRNVEYIAKRNKKGELNFIECKCIKFGRDIFKYEHHEYDSAHFIEFNAYKRLSNEIQTKILECYKRINPLASFSSIQKTPDKKLDNFYNCDNISFIKDYEDPYCSSKTLHKAIITLLYILRNKLFHGELPPYEAVQPVYKNAYFILKIILEKLK